jgi:hypothetical protein
MIRILIRIQMASKKVEELTLVECRTIFERIGQSHHKKNKAEMQSYMKTHNIDHISVLSGNQAPAKAEKSQEVTAKAEKSQEATAKAEKSQEAPAKAEKSQEATAKAEKSQEATAKAEKSQEATAKAEKSQEAPAKVEAPPVVKEVKEEQKEEPNVAQVSQGSPETPEPNKEASSDTPVKKTKPKKVTGPKNGAKKSLVVSHYTRTPTSKVKPLTLKTGAAKKPATPKKAEGTKAAPKRMYVLVDSQRVFISAYMGAKAAKDAIATKYKDLDLVWVELISDSGSKGYKMLMQV